MAGIKVTIDGLANLEQRLSAKNINKSLIPAVNQSILKVHSFLKNEVIKEYTFKNNLDSVLFGGVRGATSTVTQTAIEDGLVYEHKPVRLVQFKYNLKTVSASSRFRFIDANGRKRIKEKDKAIAVEVLIKRSNGYKTVIGNGNGGFYQGQDNSGWDKYRQKKKVIRRQSNIYMRKERDTWTDRTWDAKRTGLQVLYGPSLSQAAGSILKRPTVINRLRQQAADEIARYLQLNL